MQDQLQQLIANYSPSSDAIDLIKQTRISLLAGISGAGKNTIKRALLDEGSDFHDIVSHTTRSPRQNNSIMETDGVDYHFISLDTAKEMLENYDFVEAKFVHGTVYGTSVAEIRKAHLDNKVAISDVDVQGVAEFKQIAPDSVSIFIVPPSYDEWLSRLKARYSTEEEFFAEWHKRRQSSINELKHALEVPYYHFIINDDIERATRVSREIILRDDVFYEKDIEARILAEQLLEDIKNS